MNYKTPEECGISSANIEKFIRELEENRLFTHDIIIAKGNDIIFEKYWEPFDENFLHRQYSITKSIVALAVGFAIQDGLVDIDAPISKYFPEEAKLAKSELIKNQTIREMLTMSTALIPENWFSASCTDRVAFYFENANIDNKRPAGTIYRYDSSGSFVVSAMVERVTGKKLMDYMREKCFDKIGVSKEATCLTCPGGHSWGDSALICTPRDMLRIARFTMNYGKWNGEQLLNEEFVRTATSRLVDNNIGSVYSFNTQGYGYYFFRSYDNTFFFSGMGCQFAICSPDKDIILIYNSDNQGNQMAASVIFDSFFRNVMRAENNLENPEAQQKSLAEYTNNLKLGVVSGSEKSDFSETINEKTFCFKDNPMNLKWVKFTFGSDECALDYENATGKKTLKFGMAKNAFGIFPEEGYSDLVGSKYAKGNFYKCAASAAWTEPKKLTIHIQVIDKYFGKLTMQFGFKDEKTLGVVMTPAAEDFFKEYFGYAEAYAE